MVFNNSILAGSSTQEEDVYEIAQSILFDDSHPAYMRRTPSSASNKRTWTYSLWIKRADQPANYSPGMLLLQHGNSGTGLQETIRINTASGSTHSTLMYYSDSPSSNLTTTQVLRDGASWYHIVVAKDTTQSTASDRVKIYINGQRVTSFSTETYPSLNGEGFINSNVLHNISADQNGGSNYDGYMAEMHFIDGSQLDPSSFGKTNSKGIWVPIEYEGSYGTNGWHIDGRDSGDLGDDESGNGNDWATTNLVAADQAPDTPTNNFTIMNILDNYPHQGAFSKGNLQIVSFQTSYHSHTSTMGLKRGKWYAEIKWTAQGTSPSGYYSNTFFGIVGSVDTTSSIGVGTRSDSYCYIGTTAGSGEDGGKKRNNATASAYGADYAVGDIVGIALDLDNNKIYWSKNGTFQNSGNPASGSTGTGSAFDLTTPSSGFYYFAVSDQHGDSSSTWQINFGSAPPYTISSGNADGNGYGNFEYAVPSGYYSVCTKNISEFG